jgi:DNA-binding NtrC family response regulator
MAKLLGYPWPGNIRELENLIERMVILAEDDHLTMKDLPSPHQRGGNTAQGAMIEVTEEGIDFNQVVSDFEKPVAFAGWSAPNWSEQAAACSS